ncbi:MAG: tRNA (adenosine(37)-N6)-threonylcarbamoyltransferase complex ATPase subunit type 1 TsaE [Ignavibacteria bacterium GWB2_36_8]|nr:MAG: tRNA (adenosine(37)-N6)-threonylcarbamoyltransferase complex ATPase subunit type 1 TsaE [Ignavibacteria bacterium GWB2_36_8]OGU93499.1 MAG: tRNA (adenosine(37)-N6)-threonylcarbamoyltransferase complex ATPase subunit type 1 TsaE [Ignavibacteria bacterium RIFOXYB2_FULL_36_7]
MDYPFEKKIIREEETKTLAEYFAEETKSGQIIVINGELGAGKTFFVKCAVSVWGIVNASSPSFAIVNIYYGERKIYHFDFYRLKNKEELFEIGFNDYINDPDAITFIEWGNLIPDVLPKSRIEINIEMPEDSVRNFRFNKYE